MTDTERRSFLTGLGLNAKAAILADVDTEIPVGAEIKLSPEGVDPHTMPVSSIAFDERLLDEFPDLTGSNFRAASDKVFALYKSPQRDKDRHSLLHRKITEFIGQVRRGRETGGFVKGKIKATKEHRDLAALLAEHNITAADLTKLIKGES